MVIVWALVIVSALPGTANAGAVPLMREPTGRGPKATSARSIRNGALIAPEGLYPGCTGSACDSAGMASWCVYNGVETEVCCITGDSQLINCNYHIMCSEPQNCPLPAPSTTSTPSPSVTPVTCKAASTELRWQGDTSSLPVYHRSGRAAAVGAKPIEPASEPDSSTPLQQRGNSKSRMPLRVQLGRLSGPERLLRFVFCFAGDEDINFDCTTGNLDLNIGTTSQGTGTVMHIPAI